MTDPNELFRRCPGCNTIKPAPDFEQDGWLPVGLCQVCRDEAAQTLKQGLPPGWKRAPVIQRAWHKATDAPAAKCLRRNSWKGRFQKLWAKAEAEGVVYGKVCFLCGKPKTVRGFWVDPDQPDGLCNFCSTCGGESGAQPPGPGVHRTARPPSELPDSNVGYGEDDIVTFGTSEAYQLTEAEAAKEAAETGGRKVTNDGH